MQSWERSSMLKVRCRNGEMLQPANVLMRGIPCFGRRVRAESYLPGTLPKNGIEKNGPKMFLSGLVRNLDV